VTIALPTSIDMTVAECDPSIKGATAAAQTKPAVMETGLKVNVPPFISPGDVISVDTRDGKYIGRASAGG
jgi:elongation factor P